MKTIDKKTERYLEARGLEAWAEFRFDYDADRETDDLIVEIGEMDCSEPEAAYILRGGQDRFQLHHQMHDIVGDLPLFVAVDGIRAFLRQYADCYKLAKIQESENTS